MLDLSELGDSEALEQIGHLIDEATDRADSGGLEQGIQLCEELRERDPPTEVVALSLYFESNAWESLRRQRRNEESMWEWEQPEYEKAILALRRARALAEEAGLSSYRRAQIATNLANALSHVGRVVEALDLWREAQERVTAFPMAQGNYGRGLYYLAQRTHDPGHQVLLLRGAYTNLRRALDPPLHPEAAKPFEELSANISKLLGDRLEQPFDLDHHDLGAEPDEVAYREWVLRNHLFLNPLNELGSHSVAAADPLTLPGITQPISEGPYYIGFFNQVKQEYVVSRHSLYSGLESSGVHYSDRDVKVVNTLDYPVYSWKMEQVKVAYRLAYSLMDKVAFFVNQYLALGVREREVSFRTIWYRKRSKKKGLRQGLELRRNVGLMALFWVSKDLFEEGEGFQESLDPDAQDLAEVRNQLEHKYLKVHETGWLAGVEAQTEHQFGERDTLAYSLSRHDMEQKALRMVKLARAALLYLTQTVLLEERSGSEKESELQMPMFLDDYEDDWKE